MPCRVSIWALFQQELRSLFSQNRLFCPNWENAPEGRSSDQQSGVNDNWNAEDVPTAIPGSVIGFTLNRSRDKGFSP